MRHEDESPEAVPDEEFHDRPSNDAFERFEEPVRGHYPFSLFLLLFFVFFVLLNMQFLSISGVEEDEDPTKGSGGSAVRVFHLFSLVLALYVVPAIPWLKIPFASAVYFGTAIVCNFIAYKTAGDFSGRVVTLFFSGLMFLTGLYAGQFYHRERVLWIIRTVFIIAQAAIFLKIMGYVSLYGDIPRKNGHRPDILIFYAGGNNIEATWMALATVFFTQEWKFVPLWLNCVFTSAMYLSRVGIVVPFMALGYRVASWRTLPTVMWLTAFGAVAIIVLLPFAEKIPVVERFSRIGEEGEKGSNTRLWMWEAGMEAVRDNPWGYGIGRVIKPIEKIIGKELHENNVHNVYLQMLLEGGFPTLLAYLFLVVNLSIRVISGGYKEPFGVFVLLYFVICLIQFTGQEPFAWLFMGLAYAVPMESVVHEDEDEFESDDWEPEQDEQSDDRNEPRIVPSGAV